MLLRAIAQAPCMLAHSAVAPPAVRWVNQTCCSVRGVQAVGTPRVQGQAGVEQGRTRSPALRYEHPLPCCRVLYIDIDIHHGDGVEEAFYTTDR